MKRISLFIVLFVLAIWMIVHIPVESSYTLIHPTTFWQIQSIDTMKYSRDASTDPTIYNQIPGIVAQVASLHANYIAIDTPYDAEFLPVLTAWVQAARANNLHIWFRGNFSGWEGWFGYPQWTDVSGDHALIKKFVTSNPDLFADGDIFTPVPEPENGGMGDPRTSDQIARQFNQFLVTSYQNCVASFAQIHKNVLCGYTGMNGDVARQSLTPDTVAKTGNVVVIDHYVPDTEGMTSIIADLSQKFPQAKIVLGEFGAPIPDINGTMTDAQQADFINQIYTVLAENNNRVIGVNYWVLDGGSTSLLNSDNTPKPAAQTVASFYQPPLVQGRMVDTLGSPLDQVLITTADQHYLAMTDANGQYSFPVIPHTTQSLLVHPSGFVPVSQSMQIDEQNVTDNLILQPTTPSFWYRLEHLFQSFMKHI